VDEFDKWSLISRSSLVSKFLRSETSRPVDFEGSGQGVAEKPLLESTVGYRPSRRTGAARTVYHPTN
jgi:hypothetical protein